MRNWLTDCGGWGPTPAALSWASSLPARPAHLRLVGSTIPWTGSLKSIFFSTYTPPVDSVSLENLGSLSHTRVCTRTLTHTHTHSFSHTLTVSHRHAGQVGIASGLSCSLRTALRSLRSHVPRRNPGGPLLLQALPGASREVAPGSLEASSPGRPEGLPLG